MSILRTIYRWLEKWNEPTLDENLAQIRERKRKRLAEEKMNQLFEILINTDIPDEMENIDVVEAYLRAMMVVIEVEQDEDFIQNLRSQIEKKINQEM